MQSLFNPSEITLLAGPVKSGRSLIAADAAFRVASGVSQWLCHMIPQGLAVYFTTAGTTESIRRVTAMKMQAKRDLSDLPLVTYRAPPTLPLLLDDLRGVQERVGMAASLVAIDMIDHFLNGGDFSSVMHPLNTICDFGAHVLLVATIGKNAQWMHDLSGRAETVVTTEASSVKIVKDHTMGSGSVFPFSVREVQVRDDARAAVLEYAA